MAPPTILAHKSAFLSAQTLQLSQNLAPSGAWRNHHHHHQDAETQQATVTEKAVDDALYRLNHALQQHARRVHAPQATRHVAEQIDQLFLDINKDNDDDGAEDEADEEGNRVQKGDELRQGADFTSDPMIAALPPNWDQIDAHEAESRPTEAAYYVELQSTLGVLSTRRAETRARVERLRAMQNLLQPFRGSDADVADDDKNQNKKLQENLVTRNGEVEKELERMRMLLVRVAGRVGQLPARNATDEDGDTDMIGDLDKAERGKVQSLLDSL
ncbi:hypothetical protein PG993_011341 [Apiospora rasikravindrae]|uniref:Kinetochore protein fta4 n=1 Tax=Apiospora rasikravindrae TaxID=990691 RepID=A0ABR1SDY2_9PEZI